MIKWFGIIILATRFEFGDRSSLWSTVSQSKYRPAPDFGKTGMNRHRFDMLWRHVRWSHQPDVQYEGMSHEAHWWKFIEYFVTNFNEYHTQLISPWDLIKVVRTGLSLDKSGFVDLCGNEQEAR